MSVCGCVCDCVSVCVTVCLCVWLCVWLFIINVSRLCVYAHAVAGVWTLIGATVHNYTHTHTDLVGLDGAVGGGVGHAGHDKALLDLQARSLFRLVSIEGVSTHLHASTHYALCRHTLFLVPPTPHHTHTVSRS